MGSHKRSQQDALPVIAANKGVQHTTRKNAHQAAAWARDNAERRFETRHTKRQIQSRRSKAPLIVAGVVLVVFIICLVVLVRALISLSNADLPSANTHKSTEPTFSNGINTTEDQQLDQSNTVVAATTPLSFNNSQYFAAQDIDGTWQLYTVAANNDPTPQNGRALFVLEGTPTHMVIIEGVLVVIENRQNGWDVVSYMLSGDAQASYVTNSNGEKCQGSGTVSDVSLQDATLTIQDSTGASTQVLIVGGAV